MDERVATSARNGFVVASVILFGALASEFLQRGSWDIVVGTAFFSSQVTYWASWVYYS